MINSTTMIQATMLITTPAIIPPTLESLALDCPPLVTVGSPPIALVGVIVDD